MNFDRRDYLYLRPSLLATIVMLTLSLGLVWISSRLQQSASREQTTANRQLMEFEGKLRQVREEENEIRQKSLIFTDLNARGVIGEEKRLDWAELLKDIRDQYRLLDVQYEIAPQQILDAKGDSDYSFRSSTMRLRMKLLHEYDLIHFLNELRRSAKALVCVRSCNVSRISRNDRAQGEFAHLIAECQLEWVTILPGPKKPGGAT